MNLSSTVAYALLLTFLVFNLAVNTVLAQQTVSDLTRQSKANTDRILDEINDPQTSEEVSSALLDDVKGSSELDAPRISDRTTLYINFTAIDEELDPGTSGIMPDHKIFQIDENGYLNLEHIGQFKLSGLTAGEAELRLSAEPVFADFEIEITILPVEVDKDQALAVFGQSLFDTAAGTSTISGIPVPPDYVLGPGDEVVLQLYGSTDSAHRLEVSRDGVIDFPEVGPINVAGQTFEELRANLTRVASKRLIGVNIFVSLGILRSINVLVVGEVNAPGNQLVGALSSVVDVLIASGGINDIGSFRDIEIRRGDRKITSVDLYQLLLQGGLGTNIRLQSGDVILVPPMRKKVYVLGEVKRPAIYQLKDDNDLETVVKLAGGLTALAYSERVQIERTSDNKRILMEVDFSNAESRQTIIQDGDRIIVASIDADIGDFVQLHGEVVRPGRYAWSENLRLTDVIPSARLLRRNADLDYSILKREIPSSREIQVIPINLASAFARHGSDADPLLRPADELFVFGFGAEGQRQFLLAPLVGSLQKQAKFASPARIVSVEGGVFEPGIYPLTAEMRISDLITAAGSLREGAQGHMAELTRIVKSSTGERSFQHIPVRLEDILTGNTEANLLLQGHDSLTINTDPRWSQPHTVEITGEVKYPGIYPIARGEQLSSLIKRAGGITDIAFPDGAFLSRPSVAEREASEMRTLADAIERGMKATILERADETLRPGESLSVATDVIELLRGVEPPGRVVIDLPKILDESAGGGVSDADVLLLADDKINIPEFRQVISVIGEVNYPATHTFIDDASVSDYIEMSGGLTSKTREKLVYVVHANGTASLKTSRRGNNGINPGDTIVVPLDVEKIRSLKQWTEISSIFGNIVNPAASVVSAAALWKAAEAEVRKAEALEKSLENTRPLPVID